MWKRLADRAAAGLATGLAAWADFAAGMACWRDNVIVMIIRPDGRTGLQWPGRHIVPQLEPGAWQPVADPRWQSNDVRRWFTPRSSGGRACAAQAGRPPRD